MLVFKTMILLIHSGVQTATTGRLQLNNQVSWRKVRLFGLKARTSAPLATSESFNRGSKALTGEEIGFRTHFGTDQRARPGRNLRDPF